jgi:hypothetical protein
MAPAAAAGAVRNDLFVAVGVQGFPLRAVLLQVVAVAAVVVVVLAVARWTRTHRTVAPLQAAGARLVHPRGLAVTAARLVLQPRAVAVVVVLVAAPTAASTLGLSWGQRWAPCL